MSAPAQDTHLLADPWEMALIHRVIRHGLDESRRLVEAVPPGATTRSEVVAEHLRFTLDGLHAHHSTEDEILWPALLDRAHLSEDLIRRMEAQHDAVHAAIERVRTLLGPWERDPTSATSAELADGLDEVLSGLAEHLADEERDVVPLIARHLTQREWETLGKRSFAKFRPSQRFTAMGEMVQVATPGEAARMLAGLPVPVRIIWRLVGKRRYDRHIVTVRGEQ